MEDAVAPIYPEYVRNIALKSVHLIAVCHVMYYGNDPGMGFERPRP